MIRLTTLLLLGILMAHPSFARPGSTISPFTHFYNLKLGIIWICLNLICFNGESVFIFSQTIFERIMSKYLKPLGDFSVFNSSS